MGLSCMIDVRTALLGDKDLCHCLLCSVNGLWVSQRQGYEESGDEEKGY